MSHVFFQKLTLILNPLPTRCGINTGPMGGITID
jgi:hypothetical protein